MQRSERRSEQDLAAVARKILDSNRYM